MSVNQLTLDTLEIPFATRNLFTKHFLLSRLPKHPLWNASLLDAKKVRDEIYTLYNEKKKTIPKMSEAQLEHEFVRKVLDILEHKDSYTVQVPMLLGFGKFKKPDYVFFKDKDTKKRAYELRTQDSEGFYSIASGIGEAKEWNIDLNKKPSTQIMTYLKFGGPRWGILTNGKKWRIYHKEARVDSYYEVDLIDHLENGNDEKFNYFFLFFRREAFVAEGEKDRCFLDEVLDGSLRFAKQLEDDVRENVYRALRLLCKGFLRYPKNNLKPEDLPQIRESSLILLYRLLFVLYAEAKKLLPLEDPIDKNEYGSISLEALRRDVAGNRKDRKILPTLDTHWTHLKRLFEFINEGSEKQGVPKDELFITSYNGGLFDPDKAENRFLEKMRIGNQYLDDALDLLSRSKDDEGNLVEVDYDTLSIRHLGSIYEGLLEYKVIPASEDLAEIEGIDTYIPLRKARQEKKKIITTYEKDEPILQTDKGERKATGSYYTPDYIVKYIVKNTVGSLIEEKCNEWEAGDKKEPLWKKYLELKVLDPAMGSGHFLVEAVNFIGEEVLQAWMQQHEGDENPPLNEGTIEWARHEVVRHCVFGVDLNPLAVELAKLSLWLATVQVNRPLSFLNHHLKCGNSLIGARLNELAWYPGEKPKETTIPPALIENLESAVRKITATSDETLEGVKEQEAMFNELRKTPEYLRIKTLADARVSLYFGTTIDTPKPKDVYDTFVKTTFEGDESLWKKRVGQNWIKNAKDMAEIKHFFHWELEFPEAFFEGGKPKENPGFDTVVGNPPYVVFVKKAKGRQTDFKIYQEIPNKEFEFYLGQYPHAAEYAPNTHALMTEQTLRTLRSNGYFGFIYPSSLLYYYYFKELRRFITFNSHISAIIQIDQVFDQAETGGNAIVILQKDTKVDAKTMIAHISEPSILRTLQPKEVDQKSFSSIPWIKWITDLNFLRIYQKSMQLSQPMETLGVFYQGVCTGDNNKWLTIDSSNPLTKKVLRGRDINRYLLVWNNIYLIFDEAKMWSNTNEQLLSSTPKILIRQTGDCLISTIDIEGFFIIDSLYLFRPTESSDSLYILALLNSKLMNIIYRFHCPEEARAFAQIKIVNLKPLSIRSISFTTPPNRLTTLMTEAKHLYQEYLTKKNYNLLLGFVERRILKDRDGNFITDKEESDVIHDFLAYLAEQMIEINKLKQETLGKFKTDLEGVIGDNVRKLTRLYTPPKEPTSSKFKDEAKLQGKIKRYEEKKAEAEKLLGIDLSKKKLDLEDFPILTEDQIKELIKRKLGKIPNLSQVLMIFRKYRDEIEIKSEKMAGGKVIGLKELYARIDSPYIGSTDWLIDQIVYKLYGLTDEEIAIVEKSLGSHQIENNLI